MASSPSGFCPGCGLSWRDHEPGDTLRCPKCETRQTLVHRETYADTSPSE